MKLKERIEAYGVYFTDARGTTYAAYENRYTHLGYCISYHKEDYPAYDNETFTSIEDTLSAMREIAPLRRWKNREHS